MRKLILIAVFFSLFIKTYSQVGGNGVYKFLEVPNSARVAALGGNQVGIQDNDLDFVYHNPSLLNSSMNNFMNLNYVSFYDGIKFGYVSYARTLPKLGNFALGVHFVNYGDFNQTNNTGEITGNFTAADYALNIVWSRAIDSLFTFGANLKPLLSNLESYTSYGLALDLGITYYNPASLFSMSLVMKNLGTQIKPYYDDHYEPLPFDIQFGISKKLAHAPFRFSITAHHLTVLDMTYEKPDALKSNLFGEEDENSSKSLNDYSDMFLRHFIVGIEFVPTKNFYARFGYNHQRRQEMVIEEKGGFTGFSWGFGIKIKKFKISYGRASYHLVGGTNHFSLAVNFSEFKRQKS